MCRNYICGRNGAPHSGPPSRIRPRSVLIRSMRRDTLTVGPVWYRPTGQEHFGQHIDQQPSPTQYTSTYVRFREILLRWSLKNCARTPSQWYTICCTHEQYMTRGDDTRWLHLWTPPRWHAICYIHDTRGAALMNTLATIHEGCTYEHPRDDTRRAALMNTLATIHDELHLRTFIHQRWSARRPASPSNLCSTDISQ